MLSPLLAASTPRSPVASRSNRLSSQAATPWRSRACLALMKLSLSATETAHSTRVSLPATAQDVLKMACRGAATYPVPAFSAGEQRSSGKSFALCRTRARADSASGALVALARPPWPRKPPGELPGATATAVLCLSMRERSRHRRRSSSSGELSHGSTRRRGATTRCSS